MSADRADDQGVGRGAPKRQRRVFAALTLLATLTVFPPLAAAQSGATVEETGMELTKAGAQLRSLHKTWQSWAQAFQQSDRQAAADAVERLQDISRFLGFSALPDLSLAAAASAVRSARDGDLERATWALEDARALDAGRPEVAFATATVRRLDGDWIGAAIHAVRGYVQLTRLPLERGIWLHNAVLKLLLSLLLGGCVLVAFQMAVRGSALCADLQELAPKAVSGPLWLPFAAVVLLWPLLLPAGILWLAVYWSVLLWSYVSLSERVILVLLWSVLGVTPLALSYQQSRLQLAFVPPSRALDNLAADRLYGSLFTDLGVLRAMTPGEPAVLEMIADLHRRFDQWDHARPIYIRLAEDNEGGGSSLAAPLNNLGLYHFRNKDYGAAVDYFKRASESRPDAVEAFFNLNQAYSRMFEFGLSNDALEQANRLDRAQVDRWQALDGAQEKGIGIDGGLAQADKIREALLSAWQIGDRSVTLIDLWRKHLSLSIAAAALILALFLHTMRRQLGLTGGAEDSESGGPVNPWLEALMPGLRSIQLGRGFRGYLAILVLVGLLVGASVRGLGYRPPLGHDPASWIVSFVCLATLVLWLAARVGGNLLSGGADR